MNPLHRVAAIAIPGCALLIAGAGANSRTPEAGCRVQGVWALVSVTNNGKEQSLNGWKQMKVVTRHHFMWVGQRARQDTLPLKTEIDTLRAYFIGGGAGTYTATGNTYVEHLDVFNNPAMVGKPWNATCRVEGNRWYHSFTDPNDSTKATGPVGHVIEVWRRVE